MERVNISPRRHQMLTRLTELPVKILSRHDLENITEFVLYELCGPNCFNLKKAAYFVDNPDFNCLKGVAGITNSDQFGNNYWEQPEKFSHFMKESKFNQQVRNLTRPSAKHNKTADTKLAQDLAAELSLKNPAFYSWNMKHGNHGLLLFEHSPETAHEIDDQVLQGLCLLGFCPIF